MNKSGLQYFYRSLFVIAIIVYGGTLVYTFESTYDANVHLFFASHYADHWFDHWCYKWYGGFTVTSYPPLIHQTVALLSKLISLKPAYLVINLVSVLLFVRGIYHFSLLFVKRKAALFAALLAIFSSSYLEAVHIFGQLPSITGVAVLLNTLPFIYKWVRFKRIRYLIISVLLVGVITTIHHVTTIFGMVFFIFPIISIALMDHANKTYGDLSFKSLFSSFKNRFFPVLVFGMISLVFIICSIFPYWYWSFLDPISQVSIPHGSRDSYIEEFSSGLIFFVIPWGLTLLVLPWIFKSTLIKRNLGLFLSFSIALVLGTGGTTFLPKAVLGENAFNILTLDRFTFWATIMAIPFFGELLKKIYLQAKDYVKQSKARQLRYHIFWILLPIVFIIQSLSIINLGSYRPFQPETIDIVPIQSFLSKDNHDRWRYLTLGFGDQVAWLSANTNALSVDGNYHSARRLPELTSRAVERLENAKYQGIAGLGALQDFLIYPEKHNLKYIFNNDKFYKPVLYFNGWNYTGILENGIEIWEKPDIKMLAKILPRKNIPRSLQYLWSLLPLSLLIITLVTLFIFNISLKRKDKADVPKYTLSSPTKTVLWIYALLMSGFVVFWFLSNVDFSKPKASPTKLINHYYQLLDLKKFNAIPEIYHPVDKPENAVIIQNLTLKDGIINSFGKLNTIEILEETTLANGQQKIKVRTEWFSSLDKYEIVQELTLAKYNNEWYLVFEDLHQDKAERLQHQMPTVQYYNQGKRNIKSNTDHDDISDRPQMRILESNLVKEKDKYYIVGRVINLDTRPAYVSLKGALLDQNDEEITHFYAGEIINHRLHPKQESYFRIDFRSLKREIKAQMKIEGFDPKYIEEFTLDIAPSTIRLELSSSVYFGEIPSYTGISSINQKPNDGLEIALFNSSAKSTPIPSSLVSYRNSKKDLIDVKHLYFDQEMKPLESVAQKFKTSQLSSKQVIYKAEKDDLLVNGYQQISNFQSQILDSYKLGNGYFIDLNTVGYAE